MSTRKLPLCAPRMPGAEFFEDPRNTLRTVDERHLVAYCPTARCGLVYDFEQRRWTFTSPVTFAEFGVLTSDMHLQFTPGADLVNWIQQCSAPGESAESGLAH